MKCDTCSVEINPETDRHVVVTEQVVAPDFGLEAGDGRVLCEDCGEVEDARLGPRK